MAPTRVSSAILVAAFAGLTACAHPKPHSTGSSSSTTTGAGGAACNPGPASATFGCNEKRVVIPTRSGITVGFDVVMPPGNAAPTRAVVLLTGGNGKLSLTDQGMDPTAAQNFVVRTRDLYAQAGFVAAVPDVPSDQSSGYVGNFRSSPEHATDVLAVVGWVKSHWSVPVWLVSTSRGTISAANAAARATTITPDGLVLTSCVTASPGGQDSLANVDLTAIHVPTLAVDHQKDACAASPYSGAVTMTNQRGWPLITEMGGTDNCTNSTCECGATSYHGFNGLDGEVVPKILSFITSH
jgi:dienelactone hydrolase